MITLHDISKRYTVSEDQALRSVSLSIPQGSVVGIVGRNGSGKSTLVSIMCGLLRPSLGYIEIEGNSDPDFVDEWQRKNIAFLSQSPLALNSLTVKEAISHFRSLYKSFLDEEEVEQLYRRLNLDSVVDRNCAQLSGGQRKLVQLAIAVSSGRKLVVLDEPTNELDPINRELVWGEITRLSGEGTTVIVVTHAVAEVEDILSEVVVLDEGVVVAHEHCDGSADPRGGHRFIVRYRDRGELCQVEVDQGDVPTLVGSLASRGFVDIEIGRVSLEDRFIELVQK
ncbi:ABC transporter ATP-binding protein [Corynebacterium kroppenstedtii]|uniref:ABC transporter ATP-binding protein n=1 Tax=Corynebacterium sp. PCR 32 TaxID=3351342 RepID=UPI00309CBC8B